MDWLKELRRQADTGACELVVKRAGLLLSVTREMAESFLRSPRPCGGPFYRPSSTA